MLVVILSGCEESEEEEEERQRESRPDSTVIVGPWVTCVEPPLCNEYLTYDLQAWDDFFSHAETALMAGSAPLITIFAVQSNTTIGMILKGGFSTVPAIKSQASDLRGYAMNSAGSDAVHGGLCPYA